MKYFYSLLICLVLSTAGCKSEQQPQEVVEKYLSSIDKFNFEEAKLLVVQNEENLKSIQNTQLFSENMIPLEKEKYINEKKTYKNLKNEITGDSAKVVASTSGPNYTVLIEFKLLKQGDKWLINKVFSK